MQVTFAFFKDQSANNKRTLIDSANPVSLGQKTGPDKAELSGADNCHYFEDRGTQNSQQHDGDSVLLGGHNKAKLFGQNEALNSNFETPAKSHDSSEYPSDNSFVFDSFSPQISSIESAETAVSDSEFWRPLLLVVPLRLGLTVINHCYLDAIKVVQNV